jgi:hypothetical protein
MLRVMRLSGEGVGSRLGAVALRALPMPAMPTLAALCRRLLALPGVVAAVLVAEAGAAACSPSSSCCCCSSAAVLLLRRLLRPPLGVWDAGLAAGVVAAASAGAGEPTAASWLSRLLLLR